MNMRAHLRSRVESGKRPDALVRFDPRTETFQSWPIPSGNVFAGMVHRLDGPVAGVLVLARTSKAASRLSAQMRQGLFQKTYLAVVQGLCLQGH